MKRQYQTPTHPRAAEGYAQLKDFCRLFTEESAGLYLLALLLTRNQQQAEQCLLAALDDCLQASHVFKEWTHAWARRAILHHAIHMVGPRADRPRPQAEQAVNLVEFTELHDLPPEIKCVLQLGDLERFVFVMTVLEGYRTYECALLLDRSPQEVRRAHIRAPQRLAEWLVEYITTSVLPHSTSKSLEIGSPA